MELPVELDADEFRDAWTDWLEYKREIKKPYTSMRGVKSQITRISKWGLGRAVDAIIYSMAQNYDGIYEDKNSEKKTVRRDPQI